MNDAQEGREICNKRGWMIQICEKRTMMSDKERVHYIIDQMTPEQVSSFIILFGYIDSPIPNDETLEAIEDHHSGNTESFFGSTEDFMKAMLEDE